MPTFAEQQAHVAQLRSARDASREQVRRGTLTLRELEAQISEARRTASRQDRERLAALERERERAGEQLEHDKETLLRGRAAAHAELDLFVADPRTLIGELSDHVPFLLLPLRIETKFAGTPQARELLVRIFPDDIATAHHEEDLSESEQAAGHSYWQARAVANRPASEAERTSARESAWHTLATRHEAYRAGWIARATRPTNWADTLTDPTALVFPQLTTRPPSWSQAPRSFVMPDRVVVTLISGAQQRAYVGAAIPDDLLLGPDPLQVEGLLTRDKASGRMQVDEELQWMVDFERARAVGMALRIALEPPFDSGVIDRLVVVGIRASSDAAQAAAQLARLIEQHRYSNGISIVPQGTPTNNTETAKSGFTSSDAPAIGQTLALEERPEALAVSGNPFEQPDGQHLARALDLPIELMRVIPNAAGMDIAEAMAMNRALWPATFGGFLREMIRPLMSDATIERVREFFMRYVVGRGLLPALRVGAQPYGIVVASSLARWQWSESETGAATDFWSQLLAHLRALDAEWLRRVADVKVAGPSDDPFAHLLAVIGLQASSVEFYSRKAATDDYLWHYMKFNGTPQAYAMGLWEEQQVAKANHLQQMGLNTFEPIRIKSLTFWREHELLTGPVIDGDPPVPLAEDKPIRPYDGTHNYIHWLMLATREEIERQKFTAADGSGVSPPRALLYQLLRHAFLAELGDAGTRFARLRASAFVELPDTPLVANIGAEKSLLTRDVLNLDTSRIGVTAEPETAGDFLLRDARALTPPIAKAPEAVPLADMIEALERLAPLPTARLERIFAEHLDVCSYRLDAWLQGVFAQRLTILRSGRRQQVGIHLGAYGWVENLRPNPVTPRVVPAQELPPALREGLVGSVVEYANNGGYIHAPSLTHAVSAAVLRNAYLSHAEPKRAGALAVNLSSSRVRTALAYLEGIRNGQPLGALLGYQLERALHERHPGIELDDYIYVLRARFPLISKKLTPVADGEPAEVIEARNVIDGYDLLEYVRGKTYPYGLTDLPAAGAPAPAGPRAAAIAEEIDRLRDSMDALSDLLLAESVHQVVKGNYDRAKGVLQAVTEGEAPPELEIVTTPRSGRGFTQRVAIRIDPAQTAGWHATLTLRAAANAALNHWLTTILPAPTRVQWSVSVAGAPATFASLDTLGIEPLDILLMAADTLGDGTSEFERFLVQAFRQTQGISDSVEGYFKGRVPANAPVAQSVVFDVTAAAPGMHALLDLWPLIKALKRIVCQSRALHANDFTLPSEAEKIAPADPRGVGDLSELKARIEAAYVALDAATGALSGAMTTTIEPLYQALYADPNRVIVPAWAAQLASLRAQLMTLARGGVSEALPASVEAVSRLTIDALVQQGRSVVKLMTQRLADARAALDLTIPGPAPTLPRDIAAQSNQRLSSYTDAARLLLGRAFVALPRFEVHAAARTELAAAIAAPIEPARAAVEDWLQGLTRVRAPIGALGWLMTYHDWLQPTALRLTPVQLPLQPGEPWMARAWLTAPAAGDRLSIVLANAPADLTQPQCGLLIDEWTEVVPTARETTGLAFHANPPNAQPPQALLLAIAPVLRGAWQWEDLLAIVNETLTRAKQRAVEPDMVASSRYFQLLPTVLSEFSNVYASTFLASNSIQVELVHGL